MIKILVTGSNGQLGTEIHELSTYYPQFDFIYTDVDTLDITNSKELERFVDGHPVQYIVNCAAFTAVDKAESEKHTANLLNYTAVKYLAELSKKKNIRLIHISSDYVYSGESCTPYSEDHPTNPSSIYGQTKLNGDKEVLKSGTGLILRTSWLYSPYGNNFVKTMLKLGHERKEINVVFDQVGTPTYAHDLANAILKIIDSFEEKNSNFVPGVFHFSNEGVCSWYDFAWEIMKMSSLRCKVNPIETKDFPTSVKRPSFSVLNKNKIKSTFGFSIPYWKDSLKDCMKRLGYETK